MSEAEVNVVVEKEVQWLVETEQAILAELHEAINHLEDEKINSHAKKLALHAIKKIHETVTASGPTIARRRKQMRHRLSLPEWMFLQTLANFTFFGM